MTSEGCPESPASDATLMIRPKRRPIIRRHLLRRGPPRSSGGVDQDVDATERRLDRLRHADDVVRIGHIAALGKAVDVLAAEGALRFVQPFTAPGDDGDPGPGFAQPFSNLQAQPARSTGNERRPSLE